MKTYIMLNTKLEFEKHFFKFMNNRVFGKTMGSIRNHKDMKLVKNREGYGKYVMKSNFRSQAKHPFSKELFVVEMGKIEIKINKPVYFAQAILDPSKTRMYEFHFD